MINISRFCELLAELMAAVNNVATEEQIQGWLISVNEGHAVKKLKDKRGVWLVAKYPDATTIGNEDDLESQNEVLLFLLEKVPSGSQTESAEQAHYAKIQKLYELLRAEILSGKHFCKYMKAGREFKEEWEYDIFGGFNGVSVSFSMETYD